MNPQRGHLSAELAQAFLDGRASPEEAGRLQEHVQSCVQCSEAFARWEAIYDRLGHLEALEPATGFAGRVMARFLEESREGAVDAAPHTGFDVAGHLTPDFLLDWVDGQVTGTAATPAREHLAACASCTAAKTEWEELLGSISAVGRLAPSVGFADAVLHAAQIDYQPEVSAAALVPLRLRATTTARSWFGAAVARLRNRDRRSLAVLAGLGTAPAVVLATLGWVVLTHPLVTTAGLVRFAVLKVGQVADGLVSTVVGGTGGSALLSALTSAFELALSAPGTAALGALAVLIMLSGSTWILMRNLDLKSLAPVRGTLIPNRADRGFARASG